MSRVKIGILGAGLIAKVHIGNLKNDERVEIAGVVDLFLDKAQTLAKEAGPQASAFSSLDELFEREVGAVYVTTPNTLHVERIRVTNAIYAGSDWVWQFLTDGKSKRSKEKTTAALRC